jgi:hypothetical protein
LSQKNPKSILPRNTLTNIIKKETEKYGLEEVELKTNTLKGRFRSKRSLYANGRGVISPMHRVEKLVVSMIPRRAAMRQPYTVQECLELANSLINKSVTQVELVQWKRKMLGRNFKEENTGRVGLKGWRNFVRRNKCYLSKGTVVRFDMKRDEWCKSQNFIQMYDVIYENLAQTGLAEKWEEEKMVDKEGNIVMDEEHMYGRPTKYNLTHPEKMIFVDEVGDNTSQANDGNKTVTTYVTGN